MSANTSLEAFKIGHGAISALTVDCTEEYKYMGFRDDRTRSREFLGPMEHRDDEQETDVGNS